MGVAGWVEGRADGTGFSRLGEPGVCSRPQAPARLGAQRRRVGADGGKRAGHQLRGRTQLLRSQLALNPSARPPCAWA